MPPGMTNGIRLTRKDEDFKLLVSKNRAGQNNRQGKENIYPQTEKIMEEVCSDIHDKFKNQSRVPWISSPNTTRKLICHDNLSIQKNNSIKETFTGKALVCRFPYI